MDNNEVDFTLGALMVWSSDLRDSKLFGQFLLRF